MKQLNDIEIKERLVILLKKFDKICKENNIRYSLAYGTMLGAARHNGFIPWDDDIDVIVPQEDYLRLLKLPCFTNNTMDDEVVLCEIDNAIGKQLHYYYPFAKIFDGRTIVEYERTRDNGALWLDIFPITGLPNTEDGIQSHFAKWKNLHDKFSAGNTFKETTWWNLVSVFKLIRRKYHSFFLKKYGQKLKALVFSVDYNASSELANSIWGYGIKERMNRVIYDSFEPCLFEGEYFLGIKDFDTYLTTIYKDWRKLPPESQRVAHHYYNAYLKD